MQKCPKCGAEVYESDKRCSKCGTELNNKKTPSSKLIIGIVIAIIIVAIVGAFASGIFTGNDAAGDSSSEVLKESDEPVVVSPSENSNSGESEYWASGLADTFHRPGCEWAQKIREENKIIYDSRDDAIADGKRPCGECNP